MENIQIISVPIIAMLVYWTINIIKYTINNNEKFKRFIPLVSAGMGVVFGIVAFYTTPDIMPANNILMAVLIGGSSGLTATGTNQIFKQLNKNIDDKSNNVNESDNKTIK